MNCSDEDSATDNEQNNASFQTFQTTPEIPKIKFVVPFVECTIIKNATVVITAICNVNRLYVRLVGSDYKKMVAEIAEYVLKAKKQVKIPELDDVVLAPFEGIFYRAQILTIDTPDAKGNDLGVLFIDYGNFSKVSSKNLKKLDYKHRSLKRHAFKVTLKDVNSRIANEASLLYLNSLLENKEKLLVTEVSSNPNDRIVSLLKISTEENVNKAIVNLSVVEEVSDNDEVVMYEDISPLPLATGCEITLFVTDCKHLNSGVISCIPADSIPELCQTKKTIEEYGFKTKDMKYSPIINEVCLILVGKSWYRAVVVDQAKVKDSFDFYLIDWCRMEVNISNENIRKMPKQFGNPKPRAHLCCIQNRTSTEAKNFINNAKVDLTFTVTSIELNDENQFCLNF